MRKHIIMLFYQLSLFIITNLLGVFAGFILIKKQPFILTLKTLSPQTFLLSFAIAVLFVFLSLKFIKRKTMFKIFFIILIWFGIQQLFSVFVSDWIAIFLSTLLVSSWFFFQYVLVHNLVIVLGISGLSLVLGIQISVSAILFILGVLSIYDVFAVYKTKHMVKMFKELMNRGVIISIIAPNKTKNFLTSLKDVKIHEGFVFLGTGDIAFPLIFAISVLKISLISSLFVILGASIGALFVYLLLYFKPHQPLPALPPIAAFSILFFFLSLL